MIIDVLTGFFALLLVVNTWVSWRAINDYLATRAQRVAYILLIWGLPFVGALFVLYMHRRARQGLGKGYPGASPD